jgi:hypothetical protein
VILVAFKAIDPALRESGGGFDSHTLPPRFGLGLRHFGNRRCRSGVEGANRTICVSAAKKVVIFSSVEHPMPRKKKHRLRVTKEARRRARLGIGLPPTERTIPDKRLKPAKHKKSILESEIE